MNVRVRKVRAPQVIYGGSTLPAKTIFEARTQGKEVVGRGKSVNLAVLDLLHRLASPTVSN